MIYYLAEINPEALLSDGFKDASIWYVERCKSYTLACYDVDQCIDILINRDRMTHEEAWDYFSYNVLGVYMGPNTPMFLNRLNSEIFKLTSRNINI